jgi:hypothetical protein
MTKTMKQYFSVTALLLYVVSTTAWTPESIFSRRLFVQGGLSSTAALITWQQSQQVANAAIDQAVFGDLVSQVQKARSQLDGVPALIESEKWDSIRAVCQFVSYLTSKPWHNWLTL